MKKARQVIATLLIVGGAVLLLGSVTISVTQYQSKKKQVKQFHQMMEKVREKGKQGKQDKREQNDVTLPDGVLYVLRIPSIGTEDPVKEGVTKSALAASLGHETDTVQPGRVGNCVIAGHRNYTFGKFFNRLDEVKVGDMIYVDTVEETYTYRVRETKVVDPTEVSILENTLNEQITLYTCTPIYIATHRLVIVAERIYE
ncbi:sortase A [Lachnospiraceae bacterium XBB1006]|nr:sortase A [Lachnospiraceae bacterium XBB1006]